MTERWVLVSEDTFNDIRFGVGMTDVMDGALHATPDTIDDERVHEHLNQGGIVIITCETE